MEKLLPHWQKCQVEFIEVNLHIFDVKTMCVLPKTPHYEVTTKRGIRISNHPIETRFKPIQTKIRVPEQFSLKKTG